MKITYNSPVVLTFALLSLCELLLGYATHGASKEYFISSSWTGSILYVFGHANAQHYLSNMAFILLLGPMVEEKYGSPILFLMIVATTMFTALINLFIFDSWLIGASGIVFMLIILSSMMTMKSGTIHLTFILVVLLYVGQEIIALFIPDNISHFAHVFGGLMGGILGSIFVPIRKN